MTTVYCIGSMHRVVEEYGEVCDRIRQALATNDYVVEFHQQQGDLNPIRVPLLIFVAQITAVSS